MLSVASTRTGPKSSAIIAAPDATSGLRLGIPWGRFRQAFPKLQIRPQPRQAFERFDALGETPQVELELMEGHLSPLVWCVSEDDTELMQVQKNSGRVASVTPPRRHSVRPGHASLLALQASRSF